MAPEEQLSTEQFITEHRLELTDSPDAGQVWVGLSACEGQPFELYIQGGETGPTARQIARFQALRSSFPTVMVRIQEAFRSHCVRLGAETAERFRDRRVEVDIVTVLTEEDRDELEICCRASRGWAIFSSHVLFAVYLRDNKVVRTEPI